MSYSANNQTMTRYSGLLVHYLLEDDGSVYVYMVNNLYTDPNYVGYITQRAKSPTPKAVEKRLNTNKVVVFTDYNYLQNPFDSVVRYVRTILFEESHPLYNLFLIDNINTEAVKSIVGTFLTDYYNHE
jgi:hypothetical protein